MPGTSLLAARTARPHRQPLPTKPPLRLHPRPSPRPSPLPLPPPTKRARHRPPIAQTRYHVAGPGPPHPPHPSPTSSLPDEVLVTIFRFIDDASLLAQLRTVSTQWCRVIDANPSVWRSVSFRRAAFSRSVVAHGDALRLGARSGSATVSLAAAAGNHWARFLKHFLFDNHVLRAITIAQPCASLLVSGTQYLQSRPFPPWQGCHAPPLDGVWVAVHAARWSDAPPANPPALSPSHRASRLSHPRTPGGVATAPKLPGGALVGLIHVSGAVHCAGAAASSAPCWIWRIDRAVRLNRAVRCAGFVGLWPMSTFLTDFVVSAIHRQ
ncbi:hypothetical protein BWQ96_00572 [Gracilariopsis chorda]|uniref:F-box domain-containing protein n=1 Tax=Gracilariopsis chorda TaxID=448386 RepID=A0A2V3J5P1_9FLOR|nr:hypothetical protein BWQ96_00572 [Gracilariopsis chorda]|eukprot:PXF49694.1 hypothetical protein BWQ96_00572 [Gracilariopsis chorda]